MITPLSKAWLFSFATHAFGAVVVCAAWAYHPAPLAMEIVDVHVHSGNAIESIVMDGGEPPRLPPIVALPLADSSMDGRFEAVSGVQPASFVSDSKNERHAGARAPQVTHEMIALGRPVVRSTTFFGVPAEGRSVVYVIDRSASMGLHGRLQRGVNEIIASVSQLSAESRFQILTYNRQCEWLRPGGLLPVNSATIDSAKIILSQLSAEGSTDHLRAIKAALLLHSDVVYLFTDEDELTHADVSEATRFNRGQSAIHTFCLVTPIQSPTPIQELARLNRGTFRIVGQN